MKYLFLLMLLILPMQANAATTWNQLAAGEHIGIFWGATEMAKRLDLNQNGKPDLELWQAALLMASVALIDEQFHRHGGPYSKKDAGQRLTGVGIGIASTLIEVRF